MPTIFEQIAARARKENRAPLTFDSQKPFIDTRPFTSTPAITPRPGESIPKPTGVSFEPTKFDRFAMGTFNVAKVIGGAIKAIGQATVEPESRKLFRKSFEAGELATIGALKSTAGLVARKLGAEQLAAKLDDVARQSREGVEAMQAVQRVFDPSLKLTDAKTFSQKIQDPKFIAEGLGMNLPNMIAAMGFAAPAAILGAPVAVVGTLGFISAGAIEGGFARQEALKFGATEKQADRAAILTGIANGILETLPITRLLNKLGPAGDKIQRNVLTRITKGIVIQAGLEGGTESLQEIVQNAVALEYDENRELLQGAPEAGFFGLLMGGGMEIATSVGGETIQAAREGKLGLSIEDVSKKGMSPELEALAKANPALFRKAQKAANAEEFIDSVVKADKTTRENVSVPVLTDFFNKVKKESVALAVDQEAKNMKAYDALFDEIRRLYPYKESAERRVNERVELSEEDEAGLKAEKPVAEKEEVQRVTNDELRAELSKEKVVVGPEVKAEIATVEKSPPIKQPPSAKEILGQEPAPKITRREDVERIIRVRKQEEQKQQIRVIKKETMDKAKAIYDKKIEGIKSDKEILARRRTFIQAVQKQFGISDSELKSITRQDIRLMTNIQFKQFLDNIREKSAEFAEVRQARNELMQQVQDKELNIEPLREAMKLPKIKDMTLSQLRLLDETLRPYLKGDVFLGKRALETINRTELEGIRTYREARERLAKKLGVSVESLNTIKITEFDRFKGMSALSEKDPFFRMVVEETTKLRLIRNAEYLKIEQHAFDLARKLKTTLAEKLIPQQKNIAAWFNAEDKSTVQLTPAEAELIKFMQAELLKAKEYLIKMEALQKGIASDRYYPHVRRGFLEAAKEDGIIKAFKEIFDQHKLDEQAFNILDTETGEILANDKFFGFALHRTGKLIPSENIVRAFLTYMRTFKTKQALDEMTPLIMTYSRALTPRGVTKTGLLIHGNLIRFMKEWLNTQRGRRITLVAKQGGKIDWALHALRAVTTILDLGGNIAVTVATSVGEQAIQYQLLGKVAFLKAKIRAFTPRGRRITAKYRALIGKNPWTELIEPARGIGNRFNETIFVMFQDANVRRNRNFVLGSMTKEEWASETISPERQAQLRIANGRYGVVEGAGSIMGATPEAGAVKQYKTWAIPILGSNMRNALYLAKYLRAVESQLQGKFKGQRVVIDPVLKARAKRALLETYRILELGAFVLIIRAMLPPDEDDDSLLAKLKRRAYQEAMTLFGATDPSLVLSVPRMAKFLEDIGQSLKTLIMLEKYEQTRFGEFDAGELKGVRLFRQMFTPRAIKQFQKTPEKTEADVKREILNKLEDGSITVSAAKKQFILEMRKIDARAKKELFALDPSDYKKNLVERIELKEVTIKEAKEEYADYLESNKERFESKDDRTFIDKVVTYAKAIGTDPVTAFVFIFSGESIRRLDNGAIIVNRLPLEESQRIKRERGATKDLILDHNLPLQLGGSNAEDNLKLVSLEEWQRYTPIENYLGNKLRAGEINRKEAQRQIKAFKEGTMTAEEIIQ